MPCYHPITARRTGALTKAGKPLISFGDGPGDPLQLPCGQCIGCKLERSRQWAVRMMHESSLHQNNCFLTLTYDDNHVPGDFSLNVDHFQRFMKRYRKHCGPLRFFAAGEYGDQTNRPHYHACIFGHNFADKIQSNISNDNPLFISPTLNKIWPYGFATIGDLTFESAAYVARYCTKKVTGEQSQKHYQRVIQSTGEVVQVSPEFALMSRKPGIGLDWYNKYNSEVFPLDRVIVRGAKAKPPRYYDKQYQTHHPEKHNLLKHQRKLDADKFLEQNINRKLTDREEFAKLKQSFFKSRTL